MNMGRIRSYLDEVDERYKHHFEAGKLMMITIGACLIIVAIELAIA